MSELSEAQKRQRSEANHKHGISPYKKEGELPQELDGFDTKLAKELLEHTGGDPAFRLLAQSAARRATILELAYHWLSKEDIDVFWVEEEDGKKILKWQPLLNRLGSYHNGLRRDLLELGLTPKIAQELGLKNRDDLIDAALNDAEEDQ